MNPLYSPYTKTACQWCGRVKCVCITNYSAAGVPAEQVQEEKRSKPKKGHFRDTFGVAGKKHWQK